MAFGKPGFLFHISFLRVMKRKKLFLLLLLSMTAAMIVPLTGITLVESLIREKNSVAERYPGTAWAYRTEISSIGEETVSRIRESFGDAAVTAQILSDYILIDPDSPFPSGRFLDVSFADETAFSLFWPEAGPNAKAAFAANEPVCVIDDRTARTCRLKIGDKLSVRGEEVRIFHITEDRSSAFVCVPYGRLPSGMTLSHTLYLLTGNTETEKTVRDAMKALLPEGKNGNAVPLSEAYETKKAEADSTLLAVAAVTALFLFAAVTNSSLIRYGDLRIHLHDYAVSLALGCTKAGLLCHLLFENLILTPPALLCDLGLFLVLARLLPFSLSLSPGSVICVFFLAFLSSYAAATFVTNRLMKQSCVSMLKEG